MLRAAILPEGASRTGRSEAKRALQREQEEVTAPKERVVEVRQVLYKAVHQTLAVRSQRLLREAQVVPWRLARVKSSAVAARMPAGEGRLGQVWVQACWDRDRPRPER